MSGRNVVDGCVYTSALASGAGTMALAYGAGLVGGFLIGAAVLAGLSGIVATLRGEG